MSSSRTVCATKKSDAVKVSRNRLYDSFYDPVFMVSSQKDLAKPSVKAMTSTNSMRRLPEFRTMFSHTPRCTIKLDPPSPVSTSEKDQFRVHQEERQEALQQLAGVSINTLSWWTYENRVIRAHYWKYSKRPKVPLGDRVFPAEFFELPKVNLNTGGGHAEDQQTHVTVGVQTDYREGETQTDPYSPEYIVLPGTSPAEILQLATWTWGRGLPAGLEEVELIERARAKRVWEANLPALDDMSQLSKRWRMIEEMEAEEWAFRDGKIQKLQEARFAVMVELLRERDEDQNDVTESRLMDMFLRLHEEKDIRRQKLHHDHARSLRKVEARRKNVCRKVVLHGLVTDSPAYVPRIRRDTFKNQKAEKFEKIYIYTYEGLLEVEGELTASFHRHTIKGPRPKVRKPPGPSSLDLIREYRAWCEDPNQKRPERKLRRPEGKLRLMVKKDKIVPRPDTPCLEQPAEGEEKELAVIHMQKLLRGRSIQYEMYKGKENHMDLIKEQTSVHGLQPNERRRLEAEKERILKLKRERDKERHEVAQRDACQARVVSAELEDVFDVLSKELVRLQEERRIHAFMLLAERERRIREAEESGRRQVEERRRREQDEVFRQVVQVQQQTVDLYLEDVILATIGEEADQEAREEIHKKMREVNDIASAIEESRSELQSEEIVSELMYSFLIPEIEKIKIRQRVHQKQRLHLQAARRILQRTAPPSQVRTGTLQTPQPEWPSERASRQILEEAMSPAEPGIEGQQHQTNTE